MQCSGVPRRLSMRNGIAPRLFLYTLMPLLAIAVIAGAAGAGAMHFNGGVGRLGTSAMPSTRMAAGSQPVRTSPPDGSGSSVTTNPGATGTTASCISADYQTRTYKD